MAEPNFADKTIWTGDNLDILRGMNSECVDLIYLDPPFNSNQDYAAPVGSTAAGAAFKDTWTLSDLDVAWMGLIADEQPATAHVPKTAGLTHGKGMQSYLTMMAVRLMLQPTGSIYLHCDPTASHYLKLLMDATFRARNYRNEISWRRTTTKGDYRQRATNWPRVRDVMLHYNRDASSVGYNQQFGPYSEKYLNSSYRHVEEETGRRYRLDNLAAPGAGTRGHPQYTFLGVTRFWRYNEAKMQELLDAGRIVQTAPGRVPSYKRYLDEMPGVALGDSWEDISPVQGQSNERVGYPTQKPLALLERIIKASSNEGDMVLDPFCGCATACVAADKLGRKWVGIDISPKAVELVNLRLQQAMGSLFHHGYVTARTDIPRRTDIEAPIPYRQNKHVLFGQQEGLCNGCKGDFPFKLFEVDHRVPRSRGGTDHLDNLQLLCSSYNRIKGDRPHEYLVARLAEIGV